ncbi:MAG: BCD family MFS transporter [Acetobacteraceae bacterium]|nr:BCD family MFS transporter [Acetobacteraceae bacterium]
MTPLGWADTIRLGLVQMALGSVVVLVTSTLNRVMVVEFALPAILPGALVALHYGVQILRPRMGWGSDMGGRRTPWIVGGIAAMAAGALVAAGGACLMPASLAGGVALATLGFVALGLGVGAAGTSLLTLVAHRVLPNRRAAAATVLWLMMIAGIAITAGVASRLLDPFSPLRLLEITACVGAIAMVLTLGAVWRVEGPAGAPPPAARAPFLPALREIWRERQSRRFAQFVFVSMLAYSAQELLLEPFAGAVFHLTPGQTAGLTGLQHGGVLAGMALVAVGTVWAGAYRGRVMRAWTMGGCIASAVGIVLLALAAATPALPLRAVVVMLGMANGAFAVSAIGAMLGLAAEGRGARDGTRIGLWGAAQAVAFGAGGLLGTGASDLAHRLTDTPALAYGAVFVAEAATFLLAARLAAGLFGEAPTAKPSLNPIEAGATG